MVHLPNGQHLTVTPVFGGLAFKSNELSNHHSPFPPGWTVVLNSEDDDEGDLFSEQEPVEGPKPVKRHMIHRYKKPTLHNDHIYISSISIPSSNDFKPVSSPTRQIAMMLWASLYWYFHQPEPEPQLTTSASVKTPDAGKPKGDWRIRINREGIFKRRLVLQKLERMGLIASEDSAVGADHDERSGEGWLEMFVSRRSFWQLDARIYLFTLTPTGASPHPGGTPFSVTPHSSRPGSPSGQGNGRAEAGPDALTQGTQGLWAQSDPGPFQSASHLPTYYPPPPPQYTTTNGIRHPIRPKPPRQGETFYTRYIPSVGQYLSFRVASLSCRPHVHRGPVSSAPVPSTPSLRPVQSVSDTVLPTIASLKEDEAVADAQLLHKWMNDARVAYYWGEAGPPPHQEEFLRRGLESKHSFPVIGCWDGKPFGYFEIYWVKEDALGRYLGGDVGNFDRGLHCLVGEHEFRGAHRVRLWLSALVHWCWLADLRTDVVMMEPRVDNEK